jgi:excisionase family DNA binding protein
MERTQRVERTDAVLAPPLMTVAEAARVARVSQSYIRKLIRRGTIEAVRISDRETGPLRIPVEGFLSWLYGTQLPEELPPVPESDLEPWVEMPEVLDA